MQELALLQNADDLMIWFSAGFFVVIVGLFLLASLLAWSAERRRRLGSRGRDRFL